MKARSASDTDCQPHEGHGDHKHSDDCGHATIPHEEHVDYIHDAHRHAEHAGHWDEHAPTAMSQATMMGKPGGAG